VVEMESFDVVTSENETDRSRRAAFYIREPQHAVANNKNIGK